MSALTSAGGITGKLLSLCYRHILIWSRILMSGHFWGSAATSLRCGGNFFSSFVEIWYPLRKWKKFENWKWYCQNLTWNVFSDMVYTHSLIKINWVLLILSICKFPVLPIASNFYTVEHRSCECLHYCDYLNLKFCCIFKICTCIIFL